MLGNKLQSQLITGKNQQIWDREYFMCLLCVYSVNQMLRIFEMQEGIVRVPIGTCQT